MQNLVDEVCGWRVKVPLYRPYVLSFTTVTHFESVLVRVKSAGQIGWGESTPLPGYSDETVADVWTVFERCAPQLSGKSIAEAEKLLLGEQTPGFTRVPMMAALETTGLASGAFGRLAEQLKATEGTFVPLVGIVQGHGREEMVASALQLVAAGYQTLKIKVAVPPVSVVQDAACCRAIREAVGPEVKLRVDANQGYDLEQASEFVRQVRAVELELLEQPLDIECWSEMKILHAQAEGVPLMLDESIRTSQDVQRCAESQCADLVKLKLMKVGGLQATLQLAQEAQQLGLAVVIGNGVQTDIGCLQESRLQVLIDSTRAGEQNGFLKMEKRFHETSLQVAQGCLRIDQAAVDESRVAASAAQMACYA